MYELLCKYRKMITLIIQFQKLWTVSKTKSETDEDSEIFRVIINYIVTQFSRSKVYCNKQDRLEKTKCTSFFSNTNIIIDY